MTGGMGVSAHSKFCLRGAREPGLQPHPIPGLSLLPPRPWAPLTFSHCEAHYDQHTYKHVHLHDGILGRMAVPEGYPETPPSCDHALWILSCRVVLVDSLSRSCRRRAIFLSWGEEVINLAGERHVLTHKVGFLNVGAVSQTTPGPLPSCLLFSCPEKIYAHTSRVHGSASVSGTICCPSHSRTVPTALGKTLARHPGSPSF